MWLALLQDSRCDGLHCPRRLGARRANEGLGKEETKVSRVPQLEGKRVRNPVSVSPVNGASGTDVCEDILQKTPSLQNNNTPLSKTTHLTVVDQRGLNSQSVVEAGPYLYFSPYAEYRAVTALRAADS